MIIWSGWGFLSVVIAVVVGGLTTALTVLGLEKLGLGTWTGMGLVAGLAAAALVNWLVGIRLNQRPGRELIDAKTGERVVLRKRHSLFFIPMQWWSVPLAAGAMIAFVSVFLGK